MCSGSITQYSCGHNRSKYYFKCPDGKNKYYRELFPHRLVGRRFRSCRLCKACVQAHRRDVRMEAHNIEEHEENAKALLEYFRGERIWPVPDIRTEEYAHRLYSRGNRLHPWLNRGGREPDLETSRARMERSFQDTANTDTGSQNEGLRLFQEMLDRQTEIDRTGRPLRQDDREFSWSELLKLARAHSAEYRARERARWQDAMRRLKKEGFLGLYQSDPEWLLNFDDWCTGNCTVDAPPTVVELRRDINGWFQHLRSCESRLRLDWMACAEPYRKGCEASSRREFNYYPLIEDNEALTFRTWCRTLPSRAEAEVTPPNSLFISNLQGYEEYLWHNRWLQDLQRFQLEQQKLVEDMRAGFSRIPGAPLSHPSAPRAMENSPRSFLSICLDIPGATDDASFCSHTEYTQRLSTMRRYQNLTLEALALRDGRITEFTIEREEILGREPGLENGDNENGGNDPSGGHEPFRFA